VPRLPVPALVALVLAVAGCSGPDRASAAETATRFAAAVTRSDGATACGLLSPAAARKLAEDEEKDCAAAVLGQGVPPAAPIERAEVDGRQAFVVTAADTVFLSRFADAWRVIGAGCEPRGSAPYDCAVSGG
jgi:hypothetical protein